MNIIHVYLAPLPKPLPPQNLTRNSPYTSKSLPLTHGIIVIPYIDRHFCKFEFLEAHLFNELRCIFHTIHGKNNFFYGIYSQHSVAIVRISQTNSGDGPGEPLPSPKRESSKKGNIRLGLFDKTRTKYHV